MSSRTQCVVIGGIVILVAAVVFFLGIGWGLPSKASDPFLFPTHKWTGSEVVEKTRPWTPATTQASDIDLTALKRDILPVEINETTEQRAEIVRRYRLYSAQPDEMINFRALSLMNPSQGKLDPRFYQYGGLWIYPLGALLKIASGIGCLHLDSNVAYYVDNPDAFGRFYVVARAYSAVWGLVGVVAMMWLSRSVGANRLGAITAGVCFCLMPVVINAAHEAKPHLAGAVLMLLAVLAASMYVRTGTLRALVVTGVVCGAATSMVLSAVVIHAILPLMLIYRPGIPFRRKVLRLLGVVACSVMTYALFNPYVLINAIAEPSLLTSNAQNTAEMYNASAPGRGLTNAVMLILHGTSPVLAACGVLATILHVVRSTRQQSPVRPGEFALPSAGWLLAVPAVIVFLQLAILGGGKPGEYGRFALLTDIALALAATISVSRIANRRASAIACAALIALTAIHGLAYLRGFVSDASPSPQRTSVAAQLADLRAVGAHRLALIAEPAPYSLPPIDFDSWQVVILPHGWSIEQAGDYADVVVRTVDVWNEGELGIGDFTRSSSSREPRMFPTIISWADKPIEVWVHRDLQPYIR